MKKIILALGLLCFITPAVMADSVGYGPNRDVGDRNTFEDVDPELQKFIDSVGGGEKNVKKTNSSKTVTETKTSTEKGKLKFNNDGSSPSNTQYYYGRPNYGTRGKFGGGS